MNKLFTKIAALCLGATMAVGVGVAVASSTKEASSVGAAGKDDWVQVTALSGLNTTDTYVIANDADKGYFMNGTVSSGHFQSTAFGASAPASDSAAGAFKLEAVDATNNIYKIKLVSTSKYVTASKAGSGGGNVTESSDSAGWKFLVSGTSFNAIYQTAYSGKYAAMRCYNNTSWRTYSNNSATSISTSNGTVFRLYKYQAAQTYAVSFAVNTAGYGTLSSSSIANVPSGSSITVNGNKVTINGTTITATPTANTAQYTYAFSSWSNTSGTITAARTITANFTRTTNTFTVTDSVTHGSLDSTSAIEYGGDLDVNIVPDSGYSVPTSVSVTMGGNDITGDIEYEDGYLYYSPVTGDIVVTASCPASGNTYSISTSVTNGTYSGDTSITDNGGTASVTIAPTGDYKLPASVSVSGASHTYNQNTGEISLSNASGNVTINAAMVALTEYSITVNETNGSHTGASTIKESRTASINFTPASGYGHPSSVSVSGATSSWTRGTGVLSLSNPTGNVTVTYVAVGNELDSIELSANSGSYTLGDPLDVTVTAKYTVNEDADVTDSANLSVSGYDPYTEGSHSVTFSYTEGGITKSASYTATVSAKQVTTDTTWTRVTSINDLTAGTYIIGYEATAGSGTIVPLRSDGASATTTANGYFYTGTTADSSNSNTISIAKNMTSTGYEFTVEKISSDVINIKNAAGNYLGATSGGTTSNKGRLYTSGNRDETNFTVSYSSGKFSMTAAVSGSYKYLKYNSGSPRYAVYNSSANDTSFYKKGTESTGSASLIRIVCDPAIDPATGYKGGDKFVGDKVYTTDFVVKKQLDTGNELTAITGFTINGGEEVELTSTSNTITVSYTEGGIPKSTEVVVAATERAAELESVQLVEKGEVKKSGYIDFASATWNLDNIYVHYYWSDDEFDTEVTLASLVATDDASISPIKPTVGATSFTVSYEYLEVEITNNTVTLTEAVRSDYVTSMSWGNTTAAHFKHFSGEQLTEEIVNTWHVKATYAGAGEGSRLYWGDYDLYIGNKQIASLPYTWLSEDDGQALSIHYGEDIDGNEFVKTNNTAVGNICASINAIDHSETISGEIEKSATWSKDDSIAAYGTTSLCEDGVALDENIFMQGAKGDAGTEIRFWSDGIRTYTGGNTLTFTPSNGAVITKITLPTVTVTSDSTSSASSPYTITDGDSAVVFAIGSKSTIGSDIVVEYTITGSETTTVHYANDMNHFDAQKKVVEFAKFMNDTMNGTNVCSGTFANLETAWDDVAGKYDELFGASTTLNETELAWAKKMLEYASPVWGSDAEPACVEKAMKTYDYCTSKYSLDEFLDGVRTVGRAPSINPVLANLSGANNTTITIAIVISLVSVTAIGGYFFLRKRKENI